MTAQAPIGLFDSGVGGLTVVRELLWRLPAESLLYLADTAHVPYGGRPADELRRLAVSCGTWLAQQGCKLVVAACNSSSAVALEALRAVLPVPVIGVIEGGAHSAAALVGHGAVGILATAATVESGAYPAAIQRLRPGTVVHQAACPRFVPLVEAARLGTPDAYAAVCEHLAELPLHELDALVLGCTHYPFLAPLIRMRADERTHLVDPAGATARSVARLLARSDRLSIGPARHRLCATGEPTSLDQINERCFGGRLPRAEAIGRLIDLQGCSEAMNAAISDAGTARLMGGPASAG